jgi:glycosyltransferase involved in cell wall biosynthesis
MSIIIFGDAFTFPEGNASTNRVYTYAKGFVELGQSTHVVTFGNNYQPDKYGVIDGIVYHCAFKPVKRHPRFIIRNLPKFTKYPNAIKILKQINKTEHVSAIIVYTKIIPTHLLSFMMSRILHTRLVIENSEHPLRYYRKGWAKPWIGNFRLFIEMHTFDAILLITQNLIDFYKPWIKKESKIFLVPSTVDPARFDHPKSGLLPYEYIGYFGYLNFHRDRIDILMDAFASVSKTHPDIHLLLGGALREPDRTFILQKIEQLQLSDRIHVLSYLLRDEVTRYLVNAKILIMVRSNHPDTNASYPSKLTEYLATGNPVISVNVGEISNYLTNNDQVFLFKPDDVGDLTERISFVLDNYEFAKEVGKSGKDLTNAVFNYKVQAQRILDFIDTL